MVGSGWRMVGRAVLALLLLGAGLAAWVAWRNLQGETALQADPPIAASSTASGNAASNAASPAQITRGAYLARAGHCAGCHSTRGGAAYAGGQAIATPFGTVYASNLTPDRSTGLGNWTADNFWRALHHGRSRDGRLLYPAFPYPNFTLVNRADADALLAYLRSLAPVQQPNRPHALRWPYGSQAALALWRALSFRPGSFVADASHSAEWNRGAYLVNGLGHCSACHAARNLLGASAGLADPGVGDGWPQHGWRAPSLADPAQASLAVWPLMEAVQLLQTGINSHAVVQGPMAEVVAGSTQHLLPADVQAMVAYLQSLPAPPASTAAAPAPPASAVLSQGGQLYTRHCADCHGAQGQGAAGIYPPLAGNRTVTMADPRNLIQAISNGGFAPATDANPRPYGMPAFDLPHEDMAALATWLRASWGHRAAPVSALDVLLHR